MYFDLSNYDRAALNTLVESLTLMQEKIASESDSMDQVALTRRLESETCLEKMLIEAKELQAMRIELDSLGDAFCDGCTI